MSVCCFSPHWAERERLNILFDGLEPERFWIIHSRLLMWLSAAGVSYAPDSGFYWSLKAHRHWNSIPKHNTVQSAWLSELDLWQMWRFISGWPSLAVIDILYTVLDENFVGVCTLCSLWPVSKWSELCNLSVEGWAPLGCGSIFGPRFIKRNVFKAKIAKWSVKMIIYGNK